MLKVVIVFLLIGVVLSLFSGLAFLFKDTGQPDSRRTLRALGVRRRTVLAGVLTEFAALGLVAGLLAAAGASILAAVIAINLFDLEYNFSPSLWFAGLAAGVLLVCVSGFLAARGAINAPPIEVLRSA